MKSLTDNQRIQYSHLSRFKEYYSSFPDGELEFGDDPDLIVHKDDGLLGIEHTRIFRPSSSQNIVLQKKESLEQRIVDRAREIYESSGYPPLYCTVLFESKIRLGKKDVDSIAASLNRIVARYTPKVGGHYILEGWKFVSEGLSPTIKAIFLDRPTNECEMFWGVNRSGAIPNLSSNEIKKVIQKKEPLIEKYLRRCSSIWLLIVEDGFAPSCYFVIPDEVKKEIYKSSFDRIFLFRNFRCEVIELRTQT